MRRAGRIAGIAIPLLGLALAGVMLLPAAFGLQRYVITSGSMTGAYDRGSVVFDRVVPTSELRPGDVVTFQPPHQTGLVTHRIVSIDRGPGGQATFRTRGDANPVADPWRFHATQPKLPRVEGSIPYLGFVIAALDVRWVRMLVIAFPALLIAFAVLGDLWRRSGMEREVGAA